MRVAFLGGLVELAGKEEPNSALAPETAAEMEEIRRDQHELSYKKYLTTDHEHFAEACSGIGRELFARGHSLVVASDATWTADRYAVAGAVDFLASALAASSAEVIVLQPENDTRRLFPEWSTRYSSVFQPDYWGPNRPEYLKLGVIQRSDAVVIAGGALKSAFAGVAAAVSGKRVVPIGSFAGAGERLRRRFLRDKELIGSEAPEERLLRSLGNGWSSQMTTIVLDALGVLRKPKVRVFVIHGHSSHYVALVDVLERLAKEPGRNVQIDVLRDETRPGLIPVQLEEMARTADGAVALITGDDTGGLAESSANAQSMSLRARQNVLVEIGLFWARVGLTRIAVLRPSGRDIEIPSDLAGIRYAEYNQSPDETAKFLRDFLDLLEKPAKESMTIRG